MLYTMPVLISDVFDKRFSILIAATLDKSSAGWLSASVNR